MKITYGNKLKSSFLLWFDHVLLDKGEAYVNHSSPLYEVDDIYSSYYTHAAPYKGFVTDSSITGANVMSGVYIDGTFTTKGSSNFIDINFDQGQVYFDATKTEAISGDYAIKEYNVQLTDKTEVNLLFETKFELSPSTTMNTQNTGLSPNSTTYPAVFLMSQSLQNEELAFGGLDETNYGLRAMVFSDSLFSLDAINSIFMDKVRTSVTVLDETDMPFNGFGGLISDYNYTGLIATKDISDIAYIERVRVSPVNNTNIQNNNTEIFASIIDFDVSKHRYSRNE